MSIDKQAKQYIIDCINWDGYETEEPQTDKDKLGFLYKTFKAEYGWAIDRYGLQGAVREWLMGLPSSIGIAFYNVDIIELAKKWESIPVNATEKQEDKILENYWHFMAAKIVQLWNKYKVAVQS